MGLYDIFKQFLGDRSTADVTTGQNQRRLRVLERQKKLQEEAVTYLRLRQKRERPSIPMPKQAARISEMNLSEILGFESQKKKRRRQ